ncbi:exodeoxyribonuclease I [Psychromonas sp. psych-6C06]|uniref:exodeoxyribonuclease I n=1 Tax=Psychromonas sp. psych-6C06 TaxID=2058089 RepID=UPI000C32410B|nr:exodeoxyribonuclease I [Psychromonas sp. psych-6C06]PKF60653.1 exodeoxyribonuclease I [Psychromonas sp. psych-6C06]
MGKSSQEATLTNNSQQPTLYWHDYETFGLNPGADRPSQFAGIRTDLELNAIDEPNEWYCRIPSDYLPDPVACVLTGITPQQTLQHGVPENEFITHINYQFSQPNTCAVGYNSIRFDDEVTRFTLYRNFLDPYQREWKNGCSRWDIIDLVRACYALRPEGINWPLDDNDVPSFRLELLTTENQLAHDQAHDAMSDVYATIAIAKLIKQKQPKLFDYCFNLRHKGNVLAALKLGSFTPVIHVSGMFPALQGCISYILPIANHPTNKNAIIVVDLNQDLTALETMNIEEIRHYLYTPKAELPEGIDRPAIKLVHINKSPFVAPAKTLSEQRADELGIDRTQCRASLEFIKSHPQLSEKLQLVFSEEREYVKKQSVEEMLYSGGFFSNKDKSLINQISELGIESLSKRQFDFEDERLSKLLWHYRARNGEQYLELEEQEKWQRECQLYLLEHQQSYIEKIDALAMEYQHSPDKIDLLQQLHHYLNYLSCK